MRAEHASVDHIRGDSASGGGTADCSVQGQRALINAIEAPKRCCYFKRRRIARGNGCGLCRRFACTNCISCSNGERVIGVVGEADNSAGERAVRCALFCPWARCDGVARDDASAITQWRLPINCGHRIACTTAHVARLRWNGWVGCARVFPVQRREPSFSAVAIDCEVVRVSTGHCNGDATPCAAATVIVLGNSCQCIDCVARVRTEQRIERTQPCVNNDRTILNRHPLVPKRCRCTIPAVSWFAWLTRCRHG